MDRDSVSQRIKRRLQLNEIFKYVFLAGLVFALLVLSTLIYDVVSKGNSKFGCDPPAIVTIIVSPIARLVARTIEAMMPESAAGMTTLIATSNRVAPRPSAPSRIFFGTALIASSEITIAGGSQPNFEFNPLNAIQTMTAYIVQIAKGDAGYGTIEYYSI
ncbi:hypothetical protein ACW7EJ_21360, partial [Acinetobacter soli]